MSERKVLNKYYPPDYDPAKIPKLPKGARSRQWVQRVMAPFNMRCNTCGEYIARAKKFNARREKVVGEDYLGLMIFRFYIRCPRCVSEITFKTDLKNCDYEMEHGATRNFMAQTLLKREEEAAKKEKENESLDPMTVLENRTKDSQKEMAMIDTLEELQEMSRKSSKISHEDVIDMVRAPGEAEAAQELARQEAEDEAIVRSIFGGGETSELSGATVEATPRIKRLQDSSSDEEEEDESRETKNRKKTKPDRDFVRSKSPDSSTDSSSAPSTSNNSSTMHSSGSSASSSSAPTTTTKGKSSWNVSVGSLGGLKKNSLVVVKKIRKKDEAEMSCTEENVKDLPVSEKSTTLIGPSKVSDFLTEANLSSNAGNAGLLGLAAYSDSDDSE